MGESFSTARAMPTDCRWPPESDSPLSPISMSKPRGWRFANSVTPAISAAETGHLVFGTMNTVNATQTISKLIDSFPSEFMIRIDWVNNEYIEELVLQALSLWS